MPSAFEIGGAHLRIGEQFPARTTHRHLAVDHHISAVGKLQRGKGVLLHEEDGQPLFLVEFLDRLENALDDQRCKTE